MTTEFTFDDLRPELVQAVAELGYTEPTPIQAAIIPLMLTVQDVIGQAQTGTGKTAAFALPILQTMKPGSGLRPESGRHAYPRAGDSGRARVP